MQPMKMSFQTLTLECRESREVIEFARNINAFHGDFGTGKSSVARLLDFCLGGGAERTPAIQRELIAVRLTASIGEHEVMFERQIRNGGRVTITWRNSDGEGAQVSAPTQGREDAIWEDHDGQKLYTVSDTVFYLLGVKPPMVRKNKIDPDAELVRLSFRDMMWYCYLKQEEMESTFFRLDSSIVMAKSRDISRYVLGFHSDRLNTLEIDLESLVDDQRGKISAARQIRDFLSQHGFGTIEDIKKQTEVTETELAEVRQSEEVLRHSHSQDTHFVDRLRTELRQLSDELNEEEQALGDLVERVEQQEALKAELLTTKFKLARTGTAATILTGVKFNHCPACGTSLSGRQMEDDSACYLCLQTTQQSDPSGLSQVEALGDDLTNRIEELQDSIRRHKSAQGQQSRRVDCLREKKAGLDRRLNEEMADYDSEYLARFREVERQVATLEERLSSLRRLLSLPEAVANLEAQAQGLTSSIIKLREQIKAERRTLVASEKHCEDIEHAYLEALLAVKFPAVGPRDVVALNRKTWEPSIYPEGDADRAWGYANAGSGGKKTLLKVCYALAFHKVAADNGLPMPTFLIIDSPMKNISPQVNKSNYEAFYEYVLRLAEGPLSETQFILIDNDYPGLTSGELEIRERLMRLNDADNPPLIPYYRGE